MPLAGPVGTNISMANGVHYDEAQHVVFATGMGPNPERGSTMDHVAVVSVSDPKAPALLNSQQMNASIQSLLIDQSGVLPIELDSNNGLQSWRYDPTAHTFQPVGSLQTFEPGDTPTAWLHPNQQVVVAVTSSGVNSGIMSVPFTMHINSFRRDRASGALTKNANLNLSGDAGGSALSPDGRYLLLPDTQTGAVYTVTIDPANGSLTLAGKSSSSAVFYLYRFINATHVVGRAKTDNSDKLTLYTFNSADNSLAANATAQLAGGVLQLVNAGTTIYAAEASGLIEMIAADPSGGSLRVIGSVNARANALDVNPSP